MSEQQQTSDFPPTAVAVIGMAGRFPGADDVEHFWRNLRDGVEGIREFTDEELATGGDSAEAIARPNYVRRRGMLHDTDRFDASFFNFSIRDAEILEPQMRLFLEKSWEALEVAGYDALTYPEPIGVYGGATFPSYLLHHYLRDPSLLAGRNQWHIRLLNENDFLTTHVSYRIGLGGPSINVQTACSTSLVAVHVAVQALLNDECAMALAGGVSISTPGQRGYLYEEGHILSPDGHCRPFDADAKGTVEGEGVGVVVLKRLDRALEDGDPVFAVVLATAVNNDGQLKVGYTAPAIDGQADVITEAQAVAGVGPDEITYVEAHGTGTALGDPIEIAALRQVFRKGTDRVGFCTIGAVKSAIGHLDAAAGIAGLIKTVQALRYRQLPPTLHFRRPNPKLELEGSPFVLSGELREWEVPEGTPRIAGISSFGIGGTNAHAILREAPPRPPSGPSRTHSLIILSHRTEAGVEQMTRNLARWLEENPDANVADVAYTLQVGRRFFRQRRTILCRDRDDALDAIRTMDPARVRSRLDPHRMTPTVFMFPGQGAQYPGMGRETYAQEPVFRAAVDRCAELLRPHLGLDLREVVHPAPGTDPEEAAARLRRTELAQPALFALEYATARLWLSRGYTGEAFIGHSIGEYVAACLGGVMRLEDALGLVALRGRLMQECEPGAMLSVHLGEARLREILPAELDLAAVNGPELTVVAGPEEAIAAFETTLAAGEIHAQRLHTSHAFHSRSMDPVLARFEEAVRAVELQAPTVAIVSNLTGAWMTDEQARDPGYWAAHLRGTVRFDDGLRLLFQEPERILLEVGPGRSLATLARRNPARPSLTIVTHSLPGARDERTETETLWDAVAELWLEGYEPKWPALYTHERRHRLALPTYPFDRGRFWLGVRDEESLEAHTFDDGGHAWPTPQFFEPRNEHEKIMAEIFGELFGIENVSIYHNFFHLGGDSLLAVQLASRMRERFQVEIPLRVIWELRTVAQFALLAAEYQHRREGAGETIAAVDRAAAEEFGGEVDLGIGALSDAEVEAMLAGMDGQAEPAA